METCYTPKAVQWARLVDVFALGPFLIWYGWRYSSGAPTWARYAMIAAGAMTIYYNGCRFLEESGLMPNPPGAQPAAQPQPALPPPAAQTAPPAGTRRPTAGAQAGYNAYN